MSKLQSWSDKAPSIGLLVVAFAFAVQSIVSFRESDLAEAYLCGAIDDASQVPGIEITPEAAVPRACDRFRKITRRHIPDLTGQGYTFPPLDRRATRPI